MQGRSAQVQTEKNSRRATHLGGSALVARRRGPGFPPSNQLPQYLQTWPAAPGWRIRDIRATIFVSLCAGPGPAIDSSPNNDFASRPTTAGHHSEVSLPEPNRLRVLGSLALIAIVVSAGAFALAYTAGWFSPQRLTPGKFVAAFAPPTGPALGHRRNHAKGICFTGVFEGNGAGSELSHARVFARGQYPVLARFNLGTRRSERAGCDGPGARPGTADRDAGRPGMAQRHDRCAGVSRLDTASLSRPAARLEEHAPG
jgi:hypothetical protein